MMILLMFIPMLVLMPMHFTLWMPNGYVGVNINDNVDVTANVIFALTVNA